MAYNALIQVIQLLSIGLAFFVSLSSSAPFSEFNTSLPVLSKRNSPLYDLWNSIPAPKKALGTSALHFRIVEDTSDAWGITYLYGCTALMISDRTFVVVAHLQLENGNCMSLGDKDTVNRFINNKLEPELVLSDPTTNTNVELIYSSNQPSGSDGIGLIEGYIYDKWSGPEQNFRELGGTIRRWAGTSNSGTGEPDPNSPSGLAVVQYIAGNGKPKRKRKSIFWEYTKPREPHQ